VSKLVEPLEFPEEARKLLQGVLDQFLGVTFETALNVLVNIIVKFTIEYADADFNFLRKYLDDHIEAHMAARRQRQGGASG
jgi:uncharacterized SAM-dependent methyltransferase